MPVSLTVNPLTVTGPAALAVQVILSVSTLVAPRKTVAPPGSASGVATVRVPTVACARIAQSGVRP